MPPGRPRNNQISAAQARTLREIESFIAEQSFSPTVGELADRLGMSKQSVNEQLQRLERNGYIQRQPKVVRSLVVLRPAEAPEKVVPRLVSVPIVGTVAAGVPILALENICGEILIEESVVRSGSYFALKASGRSMINAGIEPGYIVVVRQQQVAENRDIVVALLDGDATLKRLHYSDGKIELWPENDRFKPIPIKPDDDFRILGKVVAIRSVVRPTA